MITRERIFDIGIALSAITPRCYHYFRPVGETDTIIWAEDGEGAAFDADNAHKDRSVAFTVDFWTRDEESDKVGQIESALASLGTCAFSLHSVTYEEETAFLHFEWRGELA